MRVRMVGVRIVRVRIPIVLILCVVILVVRVLILRRLLMVLLIVGALRLRHLSTARNRVLVGLTDQPREFRERIALS
jgi:hypothetical protein